MPVCDDCGLKLEGQFARGEFGSLTPDELHFLRVFIYCEGRIRDMEAALRVSYPTVKAHLASIKDKLNLTGPRFARPPEAAESMGSQTKAQAPEALSPEEILNRLESGGITYKDALRLLKAEPKGGRKRDESVL